MVSFMCMCKDQHLCTRACHMESGQRNVRSRLGHFCEDVDTMDSSRGSNDLRVTTLQYSHVETTSSLLGKLANLKENLKKNGLKMGP